MIVPSEFRSLIAAARTNAHAGREELLAQLKVASIEALTQQSMETWQRLGADGMNELLRARFAATKSVTPVAPEPRAAPPSQNQRVTKFVAPSAARQQWLMLPPTVRASLVGFIAGGMALTACSVTHITAGALTKRNTASRSISSWPSCPRLTSEADACIYRVQSQLTWSAASRALQIDESQLRATNRHLSTTVSASPAGARLIVWRDELRLED